jgi:hypothetical protein
LISAGTPLAEVLVHERREPLVVVPFDQVSEFVHDEIIEAPLGLLGEFEVQPDPTCLCVAAAPLGFHLPDSPVIHVHA